MSTKLARWAATAFCLLQGIALVYGQGQTIINEYSRVTEVCGNLLTLSDTGRFSVGDTVLLIQMQGAIATFTNTADGGNLTELNSAGRNEKNFILRKDGQVVTLGWQLRNIYDSAGSLQLVTIPHMGRFYRPSNLSCKAWDGQTGGVLAFSADHLIMAGNIDVVGKGFQGGAVSNDETSSSTCEISGMYNRDEQEFGPGFKGKGILSSVPPRAGKGTARAANGGGGGNRHNGGGGGGGNAGAGGKGGRYKGGECNIPDQARGMGGAVLERMADQLYLGGGGGGGHANNDKGTPGGRGGGIIVIQAQTIRSRFFIIDVSGQDVEGNRSDFRDGGGGGGGAGSLRLTITGQQTEVIRVKAHGGKGADVKRSHGAGGGGGGGVIILERSTPVILNADVSGGDRGFSGHGTDLIAAHGRDGQVIRQLLPTGRERYEPPQIVAFSIDTLCDSTSVLLVEARGTDAEILLDETVSQNGIFTGLQTGSYPLVISNSCEAVRETVRIQNYPSLRLNLVAQQPFICERRGTLTVAASGGKPPFQYTLNAEEQNTTGRFAGLLPGVAEVEVRDALGCPDADTYTIQDSSYTLFPSLPDTVVVQRQLPFSLSQATMSPYPPIAFSWSVGDSLLDLGVAAPVLSLVDQFNTVVKLEVRDAVGCTGQDSTVIKVAAPDFYVPTGFSPNGDNLNDWFGLYTAGELQGSIAWVGIYNRWGSLLREWTGLSFVDGRRIWNGEMKGRAANPGVYPYKIQVLLADGETYWLEGSITLIR